MLSSPKQTAVAQHSCTSGEDVVLEEVQFKGTNKNLTYLYRFS